MIDANGEFGLPRFGAAAELQTSADPGWNPVYYTPNPKLGTLAIRSHWWGEAANADFLKAGALLQASVISRSVPLPEVAADRDMYLTPTPPRLYQRYEGEWYFFTLPIGLLVYVQDENRYVALSVEGSIDVIYDPSAVYAPIAREVAFRTAGEEIAPSSVILSAILPTHFTIPAGAPGSSARLHTPATAPISFAIVTRGGTVGTIAFAPGAVIGTFTVSDDAVVLSPAEEGAPGAGDRIDIVSPADLFGASGLYVGIKGTVRGID